jgi:AAA+ ATPase superfamily predicted ATPase
LQEAPFVVGKPAEGEYFVNRERELERLLLLTRGIEKAASSNSVLIGLRRTGKTSILHNLARRLRHNSGVIPITINCYGLASKSRFARLVVDTAISEYVEKTGDKAYTKRLVKVLGEKAKSAVDKVSEVSFWEFSIKLRDLRTDEDILIEEALQYVESLAKEKGVYFAVILDEFQDIIEWGRQTLKRLRTIIQDQKRVCYVLSGSATTIMHNLVYEERSPFYRQLVEIPVGKLEKDVVKKFLKSRFDSVRIKIVDSETDKIATYCEGYPDYVQRLGLELYLSVGSGGSITAAQIEKAYEGVVQSLDGEFENYFSTFSPTAREILVAIAREKSKASEIAREARKHLQNISKELRMLMNYGVIERPMTGQYRMADPVLSDWLRSRFQGNTNS